MQRKRLIAVHLLNDYSGSPLVLRQVLEVAAAGSDTHIFTATSSGGGFLTEVPGVTAHALFYHWHRNKLLTLCFFLLAQFILFWRLLFFLRRSDLVYINTLLPFAAALAGRLRGCRIVYHIHEVSIRPRLLKALLTGVAYRYAHQAVFVSAYVQLQFAFDREKSQVIYNALPEQFVTKAIDTTTTSQQQKQKKRFTVLMACSLKKYKGVKEFVILARQMPAIRFVLVLNASNAEIHLFRQGIKLPANCHVYSVQKDMLPFYQEAHVVINLSLPDEWVETFGMTILEGMYCGLPAVVPPVGGVTELVTDGREGLYADARNLAGVVRAIDRLFMDRSLYASLAAAAEAKAGRFSQQAFRNGITGLLNQVAA